MGVFHSTSRPSQEAAIIRKKRVSDRKSRPSIKFLDLLSNVARIQINDDKNILQSITDFIGYPNEIEFSRDVSFPDNKHLPPTHDGIYSISSAREYYEFMVPIKIVDSQKKLLVNIAKNFQRDHHPNIFLEKVNYMFFFSKIIQF